MLCNYPAIFMNCTLSTKIVNQLYNDEYEMVMYIYIYIYIYIYMYGNHKKISLIHSESM